MFIRNPDVHENSIDVSYLKDGIYLLKLEHDNGSIIIKFIVSR
ncbi:MAG: T9SS type A sorting domain-containing protein [Bacteroidales bacterium]|nr:T9SS type A sorting domain-containing protein [Bacteroidales bacterium]